MLQAPLLSAAELTLNETSSNELAAFGSWRRHSGLASSTLAAELSQLRSLARDAATESLTLVDLRNVPGRAATLIEAASERVGRSTLLTRIRAFQHYLMMGVSAYTGRSRVQEFRLAFPRRPSRGWFDAGMAEPGQK